MTAQPEWEQIIIKASERFQGDKDALKQDRSRQRSSEILDAAVRVFARHGIARSRVADIAAEAGVPLPSLYDYFKGKEELAYAVPVDRQTNFFLEFRDQAQKMPTAREKLSHFLWLTTDFARRNPDWAQVLYLEIWPSVLVKESRVRHILDDYSRIVLALMREGYEAGEWPDDPDPYQTATILVGSMSQLIITWLLYRQPRDLVQASHNLIERLMAFLASPAPQPKTRGRRKRVSLVSQ